MKQFIIIQWVSIVVIVSGCGHAFEPEPANTPEANFESIWNTFNERYAVFEQRGVDWEQVYDTYRPLIGPESSEAELYEITTGMLAVLDDAHVSLMTTDRPFWAGKEIFRSQTGSDLFSYELIQAYLDRPPTVDHNQYVTGKVQGEIGYLWVASLNDHSPDFIDDFIAENQSSQGVIVDLRHNGGGDLTNGFEIASRFADERRLAFVNMPKTGPGKEDFGESYAYYLAPKGPQQYTGPIVVLINDYSVSAAESLAMYFMTLPHVTFIGINTAGAVGERIEKEMPNGWIYSITAQLVTLPDGTTVEGPGVSPDIEVSNTAEMMASGVDSQLGAALDYLLEIN
ncbi:MAG: S41 family peptidase [Cytophagales bacterium]|nr:S41 family peptidase [Cytophagales bacterium]